MLKRLTVAFSILSTAACAQSYTTLQWGLDKTATPYNVGINLSGTWYNIGTISSLGVWGLSPTSFNSGIQQTANPLSYNWLSALPSKVAFAQDITASQASIPEIGTVLTMTSSVGYGSTPSTNAAAFKMPFGTVVTANPGSASVWGLNTVVKLNSGIGAQTGGIGLEIDMDNYARNFTGTIQWPYAVGIYLSGDSAGTFINNAGVVVDGSRLIWDYGFVTRSSYVNNTINTASFADIDSKAPTSFFSSGAHALGLNLTGSYSTYSIAAPNFTLDNSGNITAGGTLYIGNTLTLQAVNAGVETGSVGVANTPYIDFHSSGNNIDYDFRVIATGGTGSAGNGSLSLTGAGGITVSGPATLSSGWKVANTAVSATAPTISSGFGTSPSIVSSNGTAAFQVNVGTGGTASSGVIGLPAATNGWACSAADVTTQSTSVFLTKQIASTTTSVTITNYNTAGAATAWVASDKINLSCVAF